MGGATSPQGAVDNRLGQVIGELSALAGHYGSGDTTTRLVDLVKTDKKDQLKLFGPGEIAGAAPV